VSVTGIALVPSACMASTSTRSSKLTSSTVLVKIVSPNEVSSGVNAYRATSSASTAAQDVKEVSKRSGASWDRAVAK
jgi:hypothetical protein